MKFWNNRALVWNAMAALLREEGIGLAAVIDRRYSQVLLLLFGLAVAGCGTGSPEPAPTGLATIAPDAPLRPGFRPARVFIRALHGQVDYQLNHGAWLAARPNLELPSGAAIRTGPDSYADLGDNKFTLRVTADSEVALSLLAEKEEANHDLTKETILGLQKGTLLLSVRKLTRASVFQIRAGTATAQTSRTDLKMNDRGSLDVVKGDVLLNASGKNILLHAGEYYDLKANEAAATVEAVRLPPTKAAAADLGPYSSPFDRGLWEARH